MVSNARLSGFLLGLVLVLVGFCGVWVPAPAQASSNTSYDYAMAQCAAYIANFVDPYHKWNLGGCVVGALTECYVANGSGATNSQQSVMVIRTFIENGSTACSAWAFDGSPPGPCESAQPMHMLLTSDSPVCSGGCAYKPAPEGGTRDTVRDGPWLAQLVGGMYVPTGGVCPAGIPAAPPSVGNKLCGGGSCYDTNTNSDCVLDGGGNQVCRSRTPPPSGGCITGGDTTLCVGSGQAPPLPPNPPIGDPAGDIASSDSYGHQEGAGAVTNTTVNNYNNTGSAAASGAVSGDSGNAPDSPDSPAGSANGPPKDPTKDDGDKTKASGGGNCNTPPICEGNQATCMVVTQTYLLRCPPGGAGDSGFSGDGDPTVPGLDGIGDGPGAGFMRSVSTLDKIDAGGLGLGGASCPVFIAPFEMLGHSFDLSGGPWCSILDVIRACMLFLGAFLALVVLTRK